MRTNFKFNSIGTFGRVSTTLEDIDLAIFELMSSTILGVFDIHWHLNTTDIGYEVWSRINSDLFMSYEREIEVTFYDSIVKRIAMTDATLHAEWTYHRDVITNLVVHARRTTDIRHDSLVEVCSFRNLCLNDPGLVEHIDKLLRKNMHKTTGGRPNSNTIR